MATHRWLALHPSNTTTKRLPDEDGGLTLTFGFWPSFIEDELRAKIRDVSVFKAQPAPDAPRPTAEQIAAQNKYDTAVLREAARWSIRGWDAEEPACVLEPVKADGREYQVLSDASCELLYRNRLLLVAGIQAVVLNVLTTDQKKTSGSS